jgi:hypothetical protein
MVLSARRLYVYGLSALGLIFACIGAVELLAAPLDELGDSARRFGDAGWRDDVARGLGLALTGGALWLWHWTSARRLMRDEPAREQRSTVRRAYIYLVLGSALVAAVVGLAITAYQLLQELLSVEESGGLGSDISVPLAIVLISVVVAAYHAVLLRGDLGVRAEIEPELVVTPLAPAELVVRFVGPAGADWPAVLDDVRRQLPLGYDVVPVDERPEPPPAPMQPSDERSRHSLAVPAP